MLLTGSSEAHDARVEARSLPHFGRNLVFGGVVGAVVGLLVGLILHAVVDSGSLLVYEIVAGLVGLVLGAILGAFYAGALTLPGRRGGTAARSGGRSDPPG